MSVQCWVCGHIFDRATQINGHRVGCYEGHPNPPKRRADRLKCPVCSLRHSPLCDPGERRWPVAPLVALVGGAAELCRRLGWEDARGHHGDLSDAVADRWAITCGYHPEQVWPGWCEAGLTDRDYRFVHHGGWRQSWLWLERLREAAERVAV